MIGVYVIEKTDNKLSTESIFREPKFLPLNEIYEFYDLPVTKNGYYIMPTTY